MKLTKPGHLGIGTWLAVWLKARRVANSWQDVTEFIRQCYSRYTGWCKRPTDFVFIADSLTSAAGTVVDGHIRVDGLYLLSKRAYEEGLGQRNGVMGLGSMRLVFDAQVKKSFAWKAVLQDGR